MCKTFSLTESKMNKTLLVLSSMLLLIELFIAITSFLPTPSLPTPSPPPPPTATPSPPPPPTATQVIIPDLRITIIEYNPPRLDSVGEYADIRNFDTFTANIAGYTLRDEYHNVFAFPDFSLPAGGTVRVWIRSGSNDVANIYWGRDSAFWNNNGDTGVLRHSNGMEIDRCSYEGGGSTANCE